MARTKTFTYDPTTSAGRVRLLVGDTTFRDADGNDAYRFADDEISAFLAMGSNDVDLAAALAYRNMAGSISAGGEVEVKVGPVTEKFDAAKLNAVADALERRASDRGGAFETIDVLDLDFDHLGVDRSEYVDDILG